MSAAGQSRGQRTLSSSSQLQRLKSHPMFHRIFPAEPMAVRAVLDDVRQRFHDVVCEDTLGRLELVLAEVMNNVTEHGAPEGTGPEGTGPEGAGPRTAPSIHLCVVRHDSGLACAITDDGITLPVECLSPRSLPELIEDSLPEGGFGWYLIQDLTQALCYYREDRRNFLAFSIPSPDTESEPTE